MSATACDNLKQGTINLDPVENDDEDPGKTDDPQTGYTFNHPCAYVNASDIARTREHVAKADDTDPVYACWKKLCANSYASSSYKASPVATLVRGDATGTGVSSENYIVCDRDAAAAFQLALRWQIAGESKYADAAVAILNEWAETCKKITANDNNQYLLVGFQGHTFANAAELLRDYSGWSAEDQKTFGTWLKDIWYTKSKWFVENHGGSNTCPLHYWPNWELANFACQMAIGIYLEDSDMIDYIKERFLNGTGSGAVKNMIPYDSVDDPSGHGKIAQCMESGRDQGHATLVSSISAELCQMAENVGLDFWGAEDGRVLAMHEYNSKWNVKPNGTFICTSMPFTTYKYCVDCSCKDHNHGATHTQVSADSRGTVRPCWDLIYSHYVKEKGLKAYYTGLFAKQLRYTDGVLTGDCGAGDSRYGTGSGAYDQLGWGTLLFYQGE